LALRASSFGPLGLTPCLLTFDYLPLPLERAILRSIPSSRASPHFGGYSFHVPLRAGDSVSLGGWSHTQVVCLPKEGHHPSTNRTRRRATLLIRPATKKTRLSRSADTEHKQPCFITAGQLTCWPMMIRLTQHYQAAVASKPNTPRRIPDVSYTYMTGAVVIITHTAISASRGRLCLSFCVCLSISIHNYSKQQQ